MYLLHIVTYEMGVYFPACDVVVFVGTLGATIGLPSTTGVTIRYAMTVIRV